MSLNHGRKLFGEVHAGGEVYRLHEGGGRCMLQQLAEPWKQYENKQSTYAGLVPEQADIVADGKRWRALMHESVVSAFDSICLANRSDCSHAYSRYATLSTHPKEGRCPFLARSVVDDLVPG